ncbi:MAG: Hsp70 family protein [Acidimicrobiales bacterium]
MKRRGDGVGYQLGVDIGTTHTAAAVLRQGRAEIVRLGEDCDTIPSVVFIDADADAGTALVVVGDEADERGFADPTRVARAFKRRMGDPTPVVLGGTGHTADALLAALLRRVVDIVSEREGGPPDLVTVSHPANWGAYRKDLLDEVIALAGLDNVATISDPEAAALFHDSIDEVPAGDVLAVYDLGGGTFDVAVARKVGDGFEMLGLREGIDRLGGIDFDEAVLAHISGAVGVGPTDLESDDPATAVILARLRVECAALKETLSTEAEVSVPVFVADGETEVRLTREDLEDMIRPALSQTIDALRRSLRSAPVEPAAVARVILLGGSSHIPLVARLVSEELDRPVAVAEQSKHAVALGAALSMRSWAARHGEPPGAQSATQEPPDPADAASAAGPILPNETVVSTGPGGPETQPGVTEAGSTTAWGSAAGPTAAPESPPPAAEDPRPQPPGPPPMSALMVIAAVVVSLAMIGSAIGAGTLIAARQVPIGIALVVVTVALGVTLLLVMRRPAGDGSAPTGQADDSEELSLSSDG